jgi:hypothetical protein
MTNPFNIPTPDALIQSVNAETDAEVSRIVPLIITELRSRFIGEPVSITIPENTLNAKGIKVLLAAFTDVGWKVEYRSDQRDGPYLDFSK